MHVIAFNHAESVQIATLFKVEIIREQRLQFPRISDSTVFQGAYKKISLLNHQERITRKPQNIYPIIHRVCK